MAKVKFEFGVVERTRWAEMATTAVEKAAAVTRERMAARLGSRAELPTTLEAVFSVQEWLDVVRSDVAPVFHEIAAEAVDSFISAVGVQRLVPGVSRAQMTETIATEILGMLGNRGTLVVNRLADLLDRGFVAGWDSLRLASEMGLVGVDAPGPLSAGLARMMGNTSATSMAEGSAHGVIDFAGLTGTKTWHCMFRNSRESHMDADRQTVPVDELFVLAGGEGMYPGDPSLPADESVNCQCWLTYAVVAPTGEAEPALAASGARWGIRGGSKGRPYDAGASVVPRDRDDSMTLTSTPSSTTGQRWRGVQHHSVSVGSDVTQTIQRSSAAGSWVSRSEAFASDFDGVIVSVESTPGQKAALAVPGGVMPERLHVLLCKLGQADSLDEAARQVIGSVCAAFGAKHGPIEGSVTGVGWFGSAEAVTVALVDAPGLSTLRASIYAALDEAGYPCVDEHDFTPHITLANGQVDTSSVIGQPLTFNELRVRWGHEILAFDLIGIAQPPEAPMSPTEALPVALSPSQDGSATTLLESSPEALTGDPGGLLSAAERLANALEVFGGPGSGPHPGQGKGKGKGGESKTAKPHSKATTGSGTEADPIVTSNVDDAVEALGKGQFVQLNQPDEVSTLLDKLASVAKEAKAKGEKAPVYDLCRVSVPKTNLFCAGNKGIARVDMPQLSGVPKPGSRADGLPKDKDGAVNIGPGFVKSLEASGHTVERTEVPASHLRASQRELDGAKVAGMANAIESGDYDPREGDPIFVTTDNYIIDGHHRWAASVGSQFETGKDINIPVQRINMSIIEALDAAKTYAEAEGVGGRAVGVALRVQAAMAVFGGPGSGPRPGYKRGGTPVADHPDRPTSPSSSGDGGSDEIWSAPEGEDMPDGSFPRMASQTPVVRAEQMKKAIGRKPTPGHGKLSEVAWVEGGPTARGRATGWSGPGVYGNATITTAAGGEAKAHIAIESNPHNNERMLTASVQQVPGGPPPTPIRLGSWMHKPGEPAKSVDELKKQGVEALQASADNHVTEVKALYPDQKPEKDPMPDLGNWYFNSARDEFGDDEIPAETPPVDITSVPDDAYAIELARRVAAQAVSSIEDEGGEVSAADEAMLQSEALNAVDEALAGIVGVLAESITPVEEPEAVADVVEDAEVVEPASEVAAGIRARLHARGLSRQAFEHEGSPLVSVEVEVEGEGGYETEDEMCECPACGMEVVADEAGMCPECGSELPEVLEIPGPMEEPERPFEWEGVLTVEGVPSGDGRLIEAGSLTWRELPVPLMLQTVNAPGHEGAVICGSICEVEREGKTIVGRGYFSSNDAGVAARQLLDEKSMRGISVDIDSVQVAFCDPSGVELSRDESLIRHAEGSDLLEMIVGGRVMGATLTPFPAFQEAHVYLLGPSDDTPESLVASAAGVIFRSTRLCDVVLAGGGELPSLVASAGGVEIPPPPPAAWFELQPMPEPVPFSVDADGRCFGLLAQRGTCHIGMTGGCTPVPQSNDFRMFYTGKSLITAEGTTVPVGPIIMDTVHPSLKLRASDAQAFYADTGCAIADVRLFSNEHGIVACGAVRPTVDEVTVRRFRGSDISPDWRWVGNELRIVSLLACNTSGFLVQGLAASAGKFQPWGMFDTVTGEIRSLVAAGAVHNPDAEEFADPLDGLAARIERQDALIAKLMAPHEAAVESRRVAALTVLGLDCGCGCGGNSATSCASTRSARLAAAYGAFEGLRRGAAVPAG